MFRMSSYSKAKRGTTEEYPSTNESEDFVEVMQVENDEEEALSIKVTPRHESIGIDSPHQTLDFCTTVKARSLPEDDDNARAPVDIVVALDISGSMQGRKLDLCKETISLLIRELSPQDRFGLITFGSDTNIVFPARKLGVVDKESILAKVRRLSTCGCTNLSGGIGLAAQEMQAVELPHEVRTIFLLTDGRANVGVSSKNGIVSLAKGCLGSSKKNRPISIHCFGYGADHDEEMLRDISQATEGGTYCFVEQDSDVASAFGNALGGVLSVVAQNVSVTINIANEAKEHGISINHVKHDKATKQSDGSYLVKIGDFYAEESRDILFQTTLSSQWEEANTTLPHVTVSVSYLDTINKKLVSGHQITKCTERSAGNEVSDTNKHVALQSIRVNMVEFVSMVEKIAQNNKLDEARTIVVEYIKNLEVEAEKMDESGNPLIVQFLAELNNILSGLASTNQYRSYGSKYMNMQRASNKIQRCVNGDGNVVASNVYASSKKKKWSMKLSNAQTK